MTAEKMRTIRFNEFGEPADVLRLEEVPLPGPMRAMWRCAFMPVDRLTGRSVEGGLLESCHVASGWMYRESS
jgi:hypothetical protein